MKAMTRRTHLRQLASIAAVGALPAILRPTPVFAAASPAQPAPTKSEAAAMAEIAQQTMQKYHAPGLSVAVARHGEFVYQQGFGSVDQADGGPVTPSTLFRIASTTKPITSAAIFTLVGQGRLGLDDLIFGSGGF